jgi:uncharacterized protein YjbJ (UPF0337 family)
MMNAATFKSQWKQLKGELKSRWDKLTNEDLVQAAGDFDKFIGSIQNRYGYTKDQAERDFERWYDARQQSSNASEYRATGARE